ncbi:MULTISPECIES: hypothetical protein [Bacteroides]|jgi:hypothetical protein|uniref:hypothetical protein n=1 Tax=Bacteroides TaxID=816 RepID=UPI000E529690|nr:MULTISPECIES: hypothetical protein [Bacteroides]RHL12603.1 hypothetical protein DW036_00550 [Bacteroides sp. AF39-11AC]
MNYYICDHITWKKSLSLLKNDMDGQRVYSNLWQMTRDVLMLSLSLSAMASLIILVFGLIKFIADILSGTTEQTATLFDVIIFSMACPAIFVVPLTWGLAYFGWYKNLRKINSLLQQFIASLPETEDVKRTSPVSYTLRYHKKEFHAIFEEKEKTTTVAVAKGDLILLLPYQDTQQRTTDELFKEIKGFLEGKLFASFAMGPKYMLFAFNSRPIPSQTEVKQAAETLLYLTERFQLQDPVPKEE